MRRWEWLMGQNFSANRSGKLSSLPGKPRAKTGNWGRFMALWKVDCARPGSFCKRTYLDNSCGLGDRKLREFLAWTKRMRMVLTFIFVVLASSVPAQNPADTRPAANSGNDPTSFSPLRPMDELAPPARPGFRGGVYVTGSTAPPVATWNNNSNAAGATGSGVNTNSGYASSAGATNGAGTNAAATTNRTDIANANVAGITNSAPVITNAEVTAPNPPT